MSDTRARKLLERALADMGEAHWEFQHDYPRDDERCPRCNLRREVRAFLAEKPAQKHGEDWALAVANRIADEHKGAWSGVLLQVGWMADLIRKAAGPLEPEK